MRIHLNLKCPLWIPSQQFMLQKNISPSPTQLQINYNFLRHFHIFTYRFFMIAINSFVFLLPAYTFHFSSALLCAVWWIIFFAAVLVRAKVYISTLFCVLNSINIKVKQPKDFCLVIFPGIKGIKHGVTGGMEWVGAELQIQQSRRLRFFSPLICYWILALI